MEIKCARTRCKRQLGKRYVKIWNDPTTVKGYREYCIGCGRLILKMDKDNKLEYEFITKTWSKDYDFTASIVFMEDQNENE